LAAELRGLAYRLSGGQFKIGARSRGDAGADGRGQVARRKKSSRILHAPFKIA